MVRDYNDLSIQGVITIKLTLLLFALTVSATTSAAESATGGDTNTVEQIVVTAERRPQSARDYAGSIALVSSADIARVRHQHIHELLSRAAGVWISRGSGQENLTAIRSPVLSGAGSCGAFLTLEDGIPTRPAGFCNVNQLFEINTEQARQLEVIRGPGTALYGSNALHGTINVLLPAPGDTINESAAVELGSNDYVRLRLAVPFSPTSEFQAFAIHTDDGGFRDATGYRQTKLNAKAGTEVLGGELITAIAYSDLSQQTGGFIQGQDAYKDPALNRSNPNPEAFRDASSVRLTGAWTRSNANSEFAVRPYMRHSDMTFLQHFLPGQPLEENGHVSAGVLISRAFGENRARYIAGIDIEWSDVFLRETQSGPTEGSAFLQATRPAGKHYDFSVAAYSFAPYIHSTFRLSERLHVIAGLRAEYMHYDYNNKMIDGNTRDDGTPCGFGGCLYTRPADRNDDFINFAPKLSSGFTLNDELSLFANISRGFRAPQMTELYRLQSGQQVADLDSERIDNVEFGFRLSRPRLNLESSLFSMWKRGSVYRDADGFNVDNAKSRHEGAEVSLNWKLATTTTLKLNATYAKHTYDFNQVAQRGETFTNGNDVDTAPRWLASAELLVEPSENFLASVQWSSIGPYYLDAENRFTYPGHRVVNTVAHYALSDRFSLAARINNLFDAEFADRADYAFGNYRYFPARGREVFVELAYRNPGG
ncbi:MAG: TonB-dependent receptor [Woeseiaceae bacterium]|nr:TonB-dependent receptor [Woeseiaceae bacterium]